MKVKLILAGVIVLAVAIWVATTFTGSLTTYVSIKEAQERGTRVQIMGEIAHDLVEYDTALQRMSFPISDEDGNRMQVSFAGAMPGNFDQATHVVCLGQYDGSVFVADQLLVKCPSKYAGEETS